jgi:Hypervirulence associated proteins TUDOR domain
MVGEGSTMKHDYKIGDHVEWNYEGGRASGVITEKVTEEIMFKGYVRHASDKEPQYLIKSDSTKHIAMHKGSALRKLKKAKPQVDTHAGTHVAAHAVVAR